MPAYTQQQLDDLRSAMAEGVLTVRFPDGRSITYRTLREMQEQEAQMVRSLAGALVSGPTVYPSFGRA